MFSQNLKVSFFPIFRLSWPNLVIAIVLLCNGCSFAPKLLQSESCNIQTYTKENVVDYLTSGSSSEKFPRLGILPFDVQASFAPPGNESMHWGRDLAVKFHQELQGGEDMPIIELFNRDRWPGKREEFFTGNYGAIELGRNAGYSFVLVGYLENLKGVDALTLFTKVIDVRSSITIWSAKTVVSSNSREVRRGLGQIGIAKDRPDLFGFESKADYLAKCTVSRMLSEEQ